jgi:hypothetical protein
MWHSAWVFPALWRTALQIYKLILTLVKGSHHTNIIITCTPIWLYHLVDDYNSAEARIYRRMAVRCSTSDHGCICLSFEHMLREVYGETVPGVVFVNDWDTWLPVIGRYCRYVTCIKTYSLFASLLLRDYMTKRTVCLWFCVECLLHECNEEHHKNVFILWLLSPRARHRNCPKQLKIVETYWCYKIGLIPKSCPWFTSYSPGSIIWDPLGWRTKVDWD